MTELRVAALAVQRDGLPIPTVYWSPAGSARGVVLACHGGSGHKKSNAILMIAQACSPLGLAVLAIDGPVHGERRSDGDLSPATARQAFREAWRAGLGRTDIGHDMRAALDALQRLPTYAALPVGYIGVSMGTAYGLPLLAQDTRIRAAAIGLWGTTYPASEHLDSFARQVRCSVWFTQQWNDEFFDREGSFALFDAIGAADKRLVAYPGTHKELEGERLTDAVAFVAGRLLGAASA
jgi:dienelactone hydrolase